MDVPKPDMELAKPAMKRQAKTPEGCSSFCVFLVILRVRTNNNRYGAVATASHSSMTDCRVASCSVLAVLMACAKQMIIELQLERAKGHAAVEISSFQCSAAVYYIFTQRIAHQAHMF